MKKKLICIAAILGGISLLFGLLWGGAYLYLRNVKNYTPCSLADCFYRIYVIYVQNKGLEYRVQEYGDIIFEEPLTGDLTIQKRELLCRSGTRTAYFVGKKSLLGTYNLSFELDGDHYYMAMNKERDETLCIFLKMGDCLVVSVRSEELFQDNYHGEPAAVYDADESNIWVMEGPSKYVQFFVLPPVSKIPDDYELTSETFKMSKLIFRRLK